MNKKISNKTEQDLSSLSAKKDKLLQEVIAQAKALGLPVSKKILPVVDLNSRAKMRFGCCKRQRFPGNKVYPGEWFQIELGAPMTGAPEFALRQTLAHEILHTCPGCHNHSSLWKSYAEQMNRAYGYHISRTSDPAELGIEQPPYPPRSPAPARYLLVCQSCGRQVERQRLSKAVKHPDLYRCRCGGQLKSYSLSAPQK